MDRGSILRVWLPRVLGLLLLGYLFVPKSVRHDWVGWIGLGLALVGLTMIIVSRYTLGRSFSVAAKARVLVTHGIYSRIRNPIYIGGVIFISGVCLITRIPHLWLILLVVIPMQFLRARREARVLEAAFGDAYRDYRKRTWF